MQTLTSVDLSGRLLPLPTPHLATVAKLCRPVNLSVEAIRYRYGYTANVCWYSSNRFFFVLTDTKVQS